jgi:hypothetical protein
MAGDHRNSQKYGLFTLQSKGDESGDFSVDYVHLAAFQHHFLAEFNLPVVSNFLASVNSAISARVL